MKALKSSRNPHDTINGAARYAASAILFLYAFSKLLDGQFTVIQSELDKPLGLVNGFWLTWYYFGYSKVYSSFIAAVQLLLATMLTFRSTSLVAAIAALGVVLNILIIDVAYGIGAGLPAALMLLVLLLTVIWRERELLIEIIRGVRNFYSHFNPSRYVYIHFLRLLIIAACAGFSYFIAKHNNIEPTLIDGKWQVVSGGEVFETGDIIYFEKNRAHLVVVVRKSCHFEKHFTLSGDTIRIWPQYRNQKGQCEIEGRFFSNPEGSNLLIVPFKSSAHKIELELISRQRK